ncbi:MAG: sigma-54 dependent transcriptional regulator [Planctomycetota bacterium]
MTPARILVVDDERVVRDSLNRWFTDDGYEVETAEYARSALARMAEVEFDLVITDIKMPGMDGLELLEKIKEASPDTIVLIMTAFATVDYAVRALKSGAYDFVKKPFDPDELARLVEKALEHRGLVAENLKLKQSIREISRFDDIVGDSPPVHEMLELIDNVAPTDSTVLVLGESGTGKELVARAIHAASPRRYMPIVPVSCGALPDTLMESELFGHEKGAFTGAQYRRKGKLELADGGTLFLDEIAEISKKTQVDLLRVLEEHSFTRLGGQTPVESDFRVIAATHRDLSEMVAAGTFRQDLFYRLNVVTIPVPPLRERREDIPLLAEHFVEKLSRQMSRMFTGVDPEGMELLTAHEWPGNVRELENAIERAMVVGRPPLISARNLPLGRGRAAPPAVPEFNETSLAAVEKVHIQRTLEKNEGNVTRSARELGIDRVTLYNKIKKYGLRRS